MAKPAGSPPGRGKRSPARKPAAVFKKQKSVLHKKHHVEL
ncbi:hypothetical protein KP77_05950 [Jeotgalibacillus alimentarius]|uniref:Uncharacterized protein n=1 Tax=Jeotgalibacillus alimentarius TaxID=135826 RepID=A0A0C2W969_9BACL|nr:hypothetical protein KP77_05950 [Jeotgalibacillus alimentarius]